MNHVDGRQPKNSKKHRVPYKVPIKWVEKCVHKMWEVQVTHLSAGEYLLLFGDDL